METQIISKKRNRRVRFKRNSIHFRTRTLNSEKPVNWSQIVSLRTLIPLAAKFHGELPPEISEILQRSPTYNRIKSKNPPNIRKRSSANTSKRKAGKQTRKGIGGVGGSGAGGNGGAGDDGSKESSGSNDNDKQNIFKKVMAEFTILVCTNDSRYANERRFFRSIFKKCSWTVITALASAIGAYLGIAATIVLPPVCVILVYFLKVGYHIYCSIH